MACWQYNSSASIQLLYTISAKLHIAESALVIYSGAIACLRFCQLEEVPFQEFPFIIYLKSHTLCTNAPTLPTPPSSLLPDYSVISLIDTAFWEAVTYSYLLSMSSRILSVYSPASHTPPAPRYTL